MQASDPSPAPSGAALLPLSTRGWLEQTQAQLGGMLPPAVKGPLLTGDLAQRDGKPVDVFAYFGVKPSLLRTLWYNWDGIAFSAQSSGERFNVDPAPPWPGFEDIWIPVSPDLQLCGRLGLARNADGPVVSDCIVLLPGLFGDNTTIRTYDLAAALRDAGYHVLALEQRGHGRTELRYPDVTYTYGVFEAGDLLAVASWLQKRPYVRETGLIGFCWGANTALLAAWEADRRKDDVRVSPQLAARLHEHRGERLFRAGVVAFSPALHFELLLSKLERRWALLEDPVAATLGGIVAGRAAQKSYALVSDTSLRELVLAEAEKSKSYYPGLERDGMEYLRLIEPPGESRGNKLESARMPVLIVQGVDDPVTPAQGLADLIAQVRNPAVAAVVLPGGGHCGFAPYARRYYYNLLLGFFDRDRGAAACLQRYFAAMPEPAPDAVLGSAR